MPKPKHRSSHRKRRGHRPKATPFARPISAAIAALAAAAAERRSLASPFSDPARDPANVAVRERSPAPENSWPVATLASESVAVVDAPAVHLPTVPVPIVQAHAIVENQPAAIESNADPMVGRAAAPPPLDVRPPLSLPGANGASEPAITGSIERPPRIPVIEQLRSYYHPMMVPVVLAAIVILFSNWLPSRVQPGSHIAPSPAVTTSAPPAGTPQAHTAAAVPDIAAAPNSNSLPPLAALPPSDTIAAHSTPPGRSEIDASDTSIAARDSDFVPVVRACVSRGLVPFGPVATPEREEFGSALATAAEAQAADFVVYHDEYFNLRYPGGDIPSLYGVCSDVVIRAYRALGIDLQRLVHEARVGSGDISIDHRRTETLRRFFARHGANLPVTDFADDYLPGDIVTYERPQNRGAQAHIAIVSSQTGPSGRLMIVHNRGWGPQIEDALFVDHITGHYRMSGAPRLLTSWGNSKVHGAGLNSWSTLVRRAAIVRGSGRTQKPKTTPRL